MTKKSVPDNTSIVVDSPITVQEVANKSDLVTFLKHSTGLSENKAKEVVKRTFDWITVNLALNKRVYIREFGIFKTMFAKVISKDSLTEQVDYEKVDVSFETEHRLRSKVQPALDKVKELTKEVQKGDS